jgi:hypothetical protein
MTDHLYAYVTAEASKDEVMVTVQPFAHDPSYFLITTSEAQGLAESLGTAVIDAQRALEAEEATYLMEVQMTVEVELTADELRAKYDFDDDEIQELYEQSVLSSDAYNRIEDALSHPTPLPRTPEVEVTYDSKRIRYPIIDNIELETS